MQTMIQGSSAIHISPVETLFIVSVRAGIVPAAIEMMDALAIEAAEAAVTTAVAELRALWARGRALGATVVQQSFLDLSPSVFGGLDAVVRWLPSGALGDALRQALTGHGVPLLPWLVLVVWGALLSLAVVRTFRWRD